MAELATVYGNGDNGINNAQQPSQLSNSLNGGNMRNDNNQYNSPDVYGQQQQQPQQESGTQEVDVVIEKMQERIDKQKKINELKEEMKKTKSNNDSIIDR